MSSRRRRSHTRAIRNRLLRPDNLIHISLRLDVRRAVQGSFELAHAFRKMREYIRYVQAQRAALSWLGACDVFLATVPTPTGSECRVVTKHTGGWQRMRPTPSERND